MSESESVLLGSPNNLERGVSNSENLGGRYLCYSYSFILESTLV